MTTQEQEIFSQLVSEGVELGEVSWENCRKWLKQQDWKINVLSDYPQDEVKFTVRRGFERIEVYGKSDLEAFGKAIAEIAKRKRIHGEG
ncbi:MAG: hypothetical protein R3A11_04445 [Bdellovibrionota bacterium]